MRLTPPSIALTLAVLITAGASACAPMAAPPAPPAPTAEPIAASAAAVTAAPVVPTQTAALVGEARYFGAPLADAEVTVTPVGLAAPMSTGKTDALGAYAVDVPAGVAAGTTLRILVRKGDQRAATLVKAPARSVSALDPAMMADEIGAHVFLTFGPRFAALKALADAPPADPAIEARGLAIFRATVDALRAAGTSPGRSPFERASGALDSATTVLDDTTRNALIEANPDPALVPLRSAGQQLNDLIRTQVRDHGRPTPPLALLRPIPLSRNAGADDITPAVFTGGGSSGGSSPSTTTAEGTIEFVPAASPLVNETAAPTLSTAPTPVPVP
jgi:hypothetical protein